jgi:hypothetical protein
MKNKFITAITLCMSLSSALIFNSEIQKKPNELIQNYIIGQYTTDQFLNLVEEGKLDNKSIPRPNDFPFGRALKKIQDTDYYNSKNIYDETKNRIEKIKNNSLELILDHKNYEQTIRSTELRVKDAIENAFNEWKEAIKNQTAFSPKLTITQNKPDQGWTNWLYNGGTNLWKAGTKKLAQAQNYATTFIPQSIKDSVNAWSTQKKITIFSAIVSALALAGYNKEALISNVNTTYNSITKPN